MEYGRKIKSHYYSRVSLHEAPTKSVKGVLGKTLNASCLWMSIVLVERFPLMTRILSYPQKAVHVMTSRLEPNLELTGT